MAESEPVMQGLYTFNNFLQGFVDLIPGGRWVVDKTLEAEYIETDFADRTSVSYTVGQGTGLIWNLVTLRAAAPALAGSKIPYLSKLGQLLLAAKAVKEIDRARWCMEFARAAMYSYRLYCNQRRLADGLITQEQFDAMRQKDMQNYMVNGSIWAVPGKGGLWIAMGSMVWGTINSEQKMDIGLRRR